MVSHGGACQRKYDQVVWGIIDPLGTQRGLMSPRPEGHCWRARVARPVSNCRGSWMRRGCYPGKQRPVAHEAASNVEWMEWGWMGRSLRRVMWSGPPSHASWQPVLMGAVGASVGDPVMEGVWPLSWQLLKVAPPLRCGGQPAHMYSLPLDHLTARQTRASQMQAAQDEEATGWVAFVEQYKRLFVPICAPPRVHWADRPTAGVGQPVGLAWPPSPQLASGPGFSWIWVSSRQGILNGIHPLAAFPLPLPLLVADHVGRRRRSTCVHPALVPIPGWLSASQLPYAADRHVDGLSCLPSRPSLDMRIVCGPSSMIRMPLGGDLTSWAGSGQGDLQASRDVGIIHTTGPVAPPALRRRASMALDGGIRGLGEIKADETRSACAGPAAGRWPRP